MATEEVHGLIFDVKRYAWNSENMAHAFMTENLEQPVTGV